jgi:hypothetical protein
MSRTKGSKKAYSIRDIQKYTESRQIEIIKTQRNYLKEDMTEMFENIDNQSSYKKEVDNKKAMLKEYFNKIGFNKYDYNNYSVSIW